VDLSAQPGFCEPCHGLSDLADLTTQSVNCIADMELCLYLWLWAESFGILHDETRAQTDLHGSLEQVSQAQVASTAEIRAGIRWGWLRTCAGTPVQSAAAF
jgi:hypothetical protein